jgi:hypothetical protein
MQHISSLPAGFQGVSPAAAHSFIGRWRLAGGLPGPVAQMTTDESVAQSIEIL